MVLKIVVLALLLSQSFASPCIKQAETCIALWDKEAYDSEITQVIRSQPCKHIDLLLTTGKNKQWECILSEETVSICPLTDFLWTFIGENAKPEYEILTPCPNDCMNDCGNYTSLLQETIVKSDAALEQKQQCEGKVLACENYFDKITFDAKKEPNSVTNKPCRNVNLYKELGQFERLDCLTNEEITTLCKDEFSFQQKAVRAVDTLKSLRCSSECQPDCNVLSDKLLKLARESGSAQLLECWNSLSVCDAKFDFITYKQKLDDISRTDDVCEFIDAASSAGYFEQMDCLLSDAVKTTCEKERHHLAEIKNEFSVEECPSECKTECETFKSKFGELIKSDSSASSKAFMSTLLLVSFLHVYV